MVNGNVCSDSDVGARVGDLRGNRWVGIKRNVEWSRVRVGREMEHRLDGEFGGGEDVTGCGQGGCED